MSGERSQIPPPTAAEQEEGEHLKLEKLAVEYNFLLKRCGSSVSVCVANEGESERDVLNDVWADGRSQLEEQRLFFERRLASVSESDARQLATALENDKKQLKKANEVLAQKARKLEEELTFVRCVSRADCRWHGHNLVVSHMYTNVYMFVSSELNKSLIENQAQWKERVRTLEEKNARMEHDTAVHIATLEAEVRPLAIHNER